ncbi:hypothetical protein BGW38_003998, partial [Lunasporangiospora selenospora]
MAAAVKWTDSPEQESLPLPYDLSEYGYTLKNGAKDTDDEETNMSLEDGEESRIDLNFNDIEADINLDESMQQQQQQQQVQQYEQQQQQQQITQPSGRMSAQGMSDSSMVGSMIKRSRTIEHWKNPSGKPAPKTLKEQEKEIEKLHHENFGLKIAISHLHEKLNEYSSENMDKNLQMNIMLKQKVRDLDRELKMFKERLREALNAIEALQKQKNCDLPHGMTEDQEREHQTTSAECTQLKEMIRQLEAELESMSADISQRDSEMAQLRQRVAELEEQAAKTNDLQELVENCEGQIQELQGRLHASLQRSHTEDDWEQRYLESERNNEIAQDMIRSLEKEVSRLQSERTGPTDDFQLERQQYEEELKNERLENERLSRALNQKQGNQQPLPEDWAEERDQLLQTIRNAEDYEKGFELKINEVENQFYLEMQDKITELDEVYFKLDAMEKEYQRLEAAKKDSEETNQEIVRALNAVWKLTGPLDKQKLQSGSSANLKASTILRQQHDRLQNDMVTIEQKNQELEVENERLLAMESSFYKLEEKKQKQWNEEHRALERQHAKEMDAMQEELDALSEENDVLKNELDEREDQIGLVLKEIEDKDKDLEELNTDLLKVSTELEELRQKFERDRTSWAESKDVLGTKSEEAQRLAALNSKLNDTLANLETELRDKNVAISRLKTRITELELESAQRQQIGNTNGEASKEGIIDRDTLLYAVLQHLEKILGADKRTDGYVPPKPSANFENFSTLLISRLRTLGRLYNDFERKLKQVESKTVEMLSDFVKQLDLKFGEMDRYNTAVQTAVNNQRKLREDAVKRRTENGELREELGRKRIAMDELRQRLDHALLELKDQSGKNQGIKGVEMERKLAALQRSHMNEKARWNERLRKLYEELYRVKESRNAERKGAHETLNSLTAKIDVLENVQSHMEFKNKHLKLLLDICSEGGSPRDQNGSKAQEFDGGISSGSGRLGGSMNHLPRQPSMGSSQALKTSLEVGLFKANSSLRHEIDQKFEMFEKQRQRLEVQVQFSKDELEAMQQQLGRYEHVVKEVQSKVN